MTRFLAFLFSFLSIGAIFGAGGAIALVYVYGTELPSTEDLEDYQPKMLSRVYSGEGRVIAEFARERRVFIPGDEVPELVKAAFISAEDKNFYEHPGVDALGIIKVFGRLAQAKLSGGSARVTGASTITQQVVKNFLVGDERSIERKIKEAILAIRIEGALSKTDILELYLNEIYFGARSYGIVAAAENYFGKTLETLTAEEAAYLAALPKAPSDLHPIRQYDRAIGRRNYVLEEMAQNGYLDREDADAAKELALDTILDERTPTVLGDARPDYFTDQVRRQLVEEVGNDRVYTGGLSIRATVEPDMQGYAAAALRRALEKYDRSRGVYNGPVARIEGITVDSGDWRAQLDSTKAPRDIVDWSVAVVLDVDGQGALIGIEDAGGDGTARLSFDSERRWVRSYRGRGAIRSAADLWSPGDVILVSRADGDWSLRQVPGVQGAFMAMDPHTGRVLALQGGFSFEHSVFNRAVQALRQPGSSFKPFVYAAALDAGYTPSTVVLDAPIVIRAGGEPWRPKNSSGKFYGPSPLRVGIERSRNLMTVRLAQAVGMDRVAEYAERFGVYDDMPHHLSYALGAGETTLYRMVAAYGMFANGGKRVEPTVIDRIQDRHGNTVYRHDPRRCAGCDVEDFAADRSPMLYDRRWQIMNPVTAFQLTSMMEGVVTRGTASRTVGGLGFPVAGKTGTTNDARDAWFVGFAPNLVAGCYIGFDTPEPMGKGAYGGSLCGPVFKEFMANTMATRAPGAFPEPSASQTVLVKVHRDTGERLPDDAEGDHVIVEAFRIGEEPEDLLLLTDLTDDAALFANMGANAAAFLPEGEESPLGGLPLSNAGPAAGDGEGSTAPRPFPSTVGLGTGGLY